MNHCTTLLKSTLVLALVAGLTLMATTAAVAEGITLGNGYSEEQDGKTAGIEAAKMAKKAIGGEAKVVLVYDSVGGGIEGKKAMLEGVASVFDAKIIYGCSAYAPITQDCNTGTVGVLALGGEIGVVAVKATVNDDYEACGKKIGEALKEVTLPKRTGQLVLLFGKCHIPKNDDLVRGVTSVLGEKFPIAGGAALGGLLYYRGKVLEDSNLGLLLTGKFRCGFAARNAPADEKDRVIAVAGEAVEKARDGNKAALLFAFDCGGRRGQMGGEVAKELAAMKAAADGAPIFGFYGSGETGPGDNDSAPRGVGYHIIIGAIITE